MTDTAVLGVATQTVLTGDVVDTSTAEAMIAEALLMADEAQERERVALAHEQAQRWLANAELGACVLRKAEVRTDFAQAERQAAERLLAAEQAARQMAEQMLAAEAALADAAMESARSECAARRQAETQRDIWRALASGTGGRGGRGGRGHAPRSGSLTRVGPTSRMATPRS